MVKMAKDSVTVDPVTLRVIGGAFKAIAQEMAYTIIRTAYSPIIYENQDVGAGIFDAGGNEFCESESTPMHIGSIPGYLRGILTRLEGKLEDGDIILHNHPYYGASHTPDICIAMPIFWEGELVAFAANTSHLMDVGSAYPLYCVDVVDVWSEAKLYYALKIYEKGVRNEQLWTHILDNVRTPTNNAGDIEAQIASARLGRRRFLELIGRYGLETVMSAAYEWIDYSERTLRKEIEKVPDGEYYAEGWLDDDGRNRDKPLKICVTVKIEGSDLIIDLTGSSPESITAFNSPLEGATHVAMYYIIRTIFLDEATYEEFIPQNQGFFRPIKIIAPPGSIFNPKFPRACMLRFPQVMRAIDLVLKALSQVVPEKVCAGCSSFSGLLFSGFNDENNEYWAAFPLNPGSYGGRYGKDGMDSNCVLLANIRNMPVEELELRFPLRCHRYELRNDVFPAAGRWRGGINMILEYLFLQPGFVTLIGDRHYERPWGLFGGADGAVASVVKNPGTNSQEKLFSKMQNLTIQRGDVIRDLGSMGGGYGSPYEREPEKVLEDVLDEYITLEMAEKDYGVVLDPRTMRINYGATKTKRAKLLRNQEF